MKLQKITEERISGISDFLNELSWLSQRMSCDDLESIDLDEDFPILNELMKRSNKDAESLLEAICHHVDRHLFYEQALFNLETLIDNCADPNNEVLDFNSDIKKGFELLHEREAANDFSDYCI